MRHGEHSVGYGSLDGQCNKGLYKDQSNQIVASNKMMLPLQAACVPAATPEDQELGSNAACRYASQLLLLEAAFLAGRQPPMSISCMQAAPAGGTGTVPIPPAVT